jgi:hypothetical protein
MSTTTDLIRRLREAPPNVLLQREAADALEAMQRRLDQAHRDLLNEQRESRRALREERDGAATEAMWRERQGDEYGSY